ncbi:MAG: YihY/virulence factor BrkB family protein, partial [Lachnospiraceae bacterium]|nr:YihY/virulence factor BrkB family protein [Lachnospiraceae bacterium]
MIRKLISDIQDFSESVSKKNISAFSASTAFFLFLSLIPMLILICAILPYTSLTEDILLEAIIKYTPETVEGLVTGIVADVYSRSAGVVSVAAIGTLWSAGKGVLALMRGLNAVNDVEENRNYFVVRTVASFYTLIMIVVIILSLLLMVFGNLLVNLLLKDFPRVRLVIE